MKRRHTPLRIGVALALIGLIAGPASGQIKLPIYDPEESSAPVKGVTFTPATERIDYKHGTLLRITKKDDSVVQGTLVRVDKKAERLYIRTEPGTAPVAVAINDIKAEGNRARVEKGMVEVARKPAADSPIKEVRFVRERVVQPEIFTTTIEQGPFKTSYYTSTVLSPGEMAALKELSEAEREVARLELLARRRASQMGIEDAMTESRLHTQQLLNFGLAQQQYYAYPAVYTLAPLAAQSLAATTFPDLGESRRSFNAFRPTLVSGAGIPGRGFSSFGGATNFPFSPFGGAANLPFASFGGATNFPFFPFGGASNLPFASFGGQWLAANIFPSLAPNYNLSAALAAALVPTPQPSSEFSNDALVKARERLRTTQVRTIIEDGQVVAVFYEKEK